MDKDKLIEILKKYSTMHDDGRGHDFVVIVDYYFPGVADEILASQWISVKDRLPEDKQPVWAWTPKFKRMYTVVAPLKEHFTHWMPLPAPPEDE